MLHRLREFAGTYPGTQICTNHYFLLYYYFINAFLSSFALAFYSFALAFYSLLLSVLLIEDDDYDDREDELELELREDDEYDEYEDELYYV